MSWSYSGNPSNSSNDEVRFLIGDTDSDDQLVTDEEIAYVLIINSDASFAAAEICNSIAAKFSRLADKSIGDLRISRSQQAKAYLTLAKTLSQKSSISSITPYGGGISVSDKKTVEEDTDRVKPSFSVGMDDNPPTLYL